LALGTCKVHKEYYPRPVLEKTLVAGQACRKLFMYEGIPYLKNWRMKKNIRWGILGPGRIARDFAKALRLVPGCNLEGVASRDPSRAASFAGEYGFSRVLNSYEDLATDPDIDIIYIATPHAYHLEQSLLCLRNKKPVLCEKPMALNLPQTEKMVATARQEEVFLMEGMWTRFMPVLHQAKEWVESGRLGKLQYLEADFGFATSYDAASRLFDKKLGGGSILDVGVYPIFLAAYFLGEPDSIQSHSRLGPSGVDEFCNAILGYDSGASAHIFSAITVQTATCATITGTLGKIFIPHPWYRSTECRLSLLSGEEEYFSLPHQGNGFEYEIREVMDCLQGGLLECPAFPLDFSLLLSRISDTLCRQAGVIY
jgi:predicted dehydrogenase